MRKIENPQVFNQLPVNNELLQKIYKLQLEQKKLLEDNVKHGKIVNGNIKELAKRLNHQEVEIYRQRILDLLTQHGSLKVEQMSEHVSIPDNEIIKTLATLQEENLIMLNINNGEWSLND